MAEPGYPLFVDPEYYMKCRVPRGIPGWLKIRSEYRALDRCLAATAGVASVLDVPCGPGRLFPYWRRRGLSVIGMDLSPPMVEAATKLHAVMGLPGRVGKADAFNFEAELKESVDLAASVRFAYYFEGPKRVELMRSLATVAKRYVLVQYKSSETFKGRRNEAKSKGNDRSKFHTQHATIVEDMRAAGLMPLRVEPIGEFSDRVYAIAQKYAQGAPEVKVSRAPGGWLAALLRALGG